jgi:hypothetical protein
MFIEDPSVFMADFGLPCSSGAYAFSGILSTPDETMNMGGVNMISTMYELLTASANVVAGAIVSGVSISVNSQAFTVRDVLLADDGLFSKLSLSK